MHSYFCFPFLSFINNPHKRWTGWANFWTKRKKKTVLIVWEWERESRRDKRVRWFEIDALRLLKVLSFLIISSSSLSSSSYYPYFRDEIGHLNQPALQLAQRSIRLQNVHAHMREHRNIHCALFLFYQVKYIKINHVQSQMLTTFCHMCFQN